MRSETISREAVQRSAKKQEKAQNAPAQQLGSAKSLAKQTISTRSPATTLKGSAKQKETKKLTMGQMVIAGLVPLFRALV
jgi:hypothetical protein